MNKMFLVSMMVFVASNIAAEEQNFSKLEEYVFVKFEGKSALQESLQSFILS